MAFVNRDKPDRWRADIAKSVDLFNDWFMRFAPQTFRKQRSESARFVENALNSTGNLTNINIAVLRERPSLLQVLRMTTCPPIARDRLAGLSGAPKALIARMELTNSIPPKMSHGMFELEARKIIRTLRRLMDPDIFPWLERGSDARRDMVQRAATIVADRLCGALADPIVRNAQEQRQLAMIEQWLLKRGYARSPTGIKFRDMPPATFAFRLNVPVNMETSSKIVNIPIDVAIMPKTGKQQRLPLLIEAKSAGDFTNVNKRRKEEATKMRQLRGTYGKNIRYTLFLCGYFDSGYLGYEAAEGIDWVWEHRIQDLRELGL